MIKRLGKLTVAIAALSLSVGTLTGCDAAKDSSNGNSGYSLVTSITVPASTAKQAVTVSGLDTASDMVNEIVFDANGTIYIDGAASSLGTYFDYDYSAQRINGAYSSYFRFLWSSGSTAPGFMSPVNHAMVGDFPAGDYTYYITNPNTSDVTVNIYRAYKKDSNFGGGALTLNFFVYTVGGANSVISSAADVELIKNFMNSIFRQVGVEIGTINLEFREDASAVDMVSSQSGLNQFLYAASKGTAGRSDVGINCFLMPILPNGLVGMDGSIPGPGFIHGTGTSGLVALAAPMGYVFPGYSSHESDQVYLALTLAHEIGHYLGLYHPSERTGSTHDPLTDTAECTKSYDTDHDGIVSGPECRGVNTEYLMFWTDDNGYLTSGNFQTGISGQQGQVINTHPSIL